MSRKNQSSCSGPVRSSVGAIGCVLVVVLAASTVPTHHRRRPASSNTYIQQQSTTTLRVSDSLEGSRVVLTADQSLDHYEAYRRGDRFYVRIPSSDVSHPEAIRGRGLKNVKVMQRGTESTVIWFGLQAGVIARVEQRGNQLDILFIVPGAQPLTSSSRKLKSGSVANAERSAVANDLPPKTNTNESVKADAVRLTTTAELNPSLPESNSSPQASPGTKNSLTVGQQRISPSPFSNAGSAQTPVQGDSRAGIKQRVRYWILLAQLYPIPVGIGAAVLLLLIGLLILQRRRAKTKRWMPERTLHLEAEPTAARAKPATTAPVPVNVKATGSPETARELVATKATSSEARIESPAADEHHERVTRVSEEVKKLMAGGAYDEMTIASKDDETRQSVGTELLSAIVGRNLQRRERARAAFMKHGYFDDATRDLRTAESPNERAAAARRLNFLQNREATPHLIAALDDSAPEVRRAVVEALTDLQDPAAIERLNSLMRTEKDRNVPRGLIKRAIKACTATGTEESVTMSPATSLSRAATASAAPAREVEREVIVI